MQYRDLVAMRSRSASSAISAPAYEVKERAIAAPPCAQAL